MTMAYETVVEALRMGLKLCGKVIPRGFSHTLVSALEKQILVVESGEFGI
jgi:hypothetical protein